ncbi:MAG: S8 family serine peptidase [Thermoplasmata archaeon]|jgi:subtilase family serine protease|nr:S8 family serine peptidase [Thermoplasmata archaeon]
MRSGTVARVTAVGLLLVLSGAMAALAPDGSPGAKLPSSLALVTDEVALPDHALTRPLSASTELSIALTLPYSHSVTLSRFLSNVEDPASPAYRHFLTEPQFVSEFGPTPTTVQEVTSELRSSGALDLSVTPSHNVVSAVLSAGAVEHLLGISILQYGTADGLPLYSAVGTPVLPDALSGDVIGVGGLSDGADPLLSFDLHAGALSEVPGSRASQFVLSNTSGEWFVGSDFTQAYGASSLFPGGSIGANGTFPVHLAIATLLASGYNESTNQNLPGWDPSVIQTYFNDTLPKSWPQPTVRGVPVDVDGIAAPAPGSFGSLNDSSLDEFENSLDLEMAGSLAPGASLYNFYFAGSLLTGSTPIGDLADDFADDLNAALVFPYAPDTLGVVSGSFGLPDLNDSAWDSDLTMAAGTGVTVVMASGDQGDAPDSMTGRGDGPWPVWPASVAFNTTGVTSVGGVSLSLDGVPTTTFNGSSLNVTFDSNLTGIGGMSAWWDTTGCPTLCAGTEGGISAVYPEPYWQLHSAAQPDIVRAASTQGATTLGRAGPDVAFPANSTVAYVYANATGAVYFTVLEGTSVAAPVFAGLVADLIAVENRSGLDLGLGYLDPTIYTMGSYFTAHPGAASPFLDVTVGENYVFSATAGWDATTGWGGLEALQFLAADENPVVTEFHYSGPTPGIASPPNAPIYDLMVYVILGLSVVLAILVVIIFARPTRRARPSRGRSPYGTGGPTYGQVSTAPDPADATPSFAPTDAYEVPPPPPPVEAHAAATFLCPYCGSVRPAEPVRCPRCGAL